jgi:hypothetical protein
MLQTKDTDTSLGHEAWKIFWGEDRQDVGSLFPDHWVGLVRLLPFFMSHTRLRSSEKGWELSSIEPSALKRDRKTFCTPTGSPGFAKSQDPAFFRSFHPLALCQKGQKSN